MKMFPLILTLLGCCAVAFAQEQAPPPASPTAELKKLDFLLGKRSGSGKLFAGDTGIEWSAADETRYVMNRRNVQYLRTDSKFTYKGGLVRDGLTMITWDKKEKVYRTWAFISFTMTPIESTGKWEDGKFVTVSKPNDNATGSPETYRITYVPKPDKSVTYLLESQPGGGGAWTRVEEGTFTTAP